MTMRTLKTTEKEQTSNYDDDECNENSNEDETGGMMMTTIKTVVKIWGEYDDSGDEGVTSRAKKTVMKIRTFDDDYDGDIGEVDENEGRDEVKNDGWR